MECSVLRKSYRVKSEKDFQKVFVTGKSYANKAFVIYVLKQSENKHFRVGISVGKKVGHTAVARNKLKRYIRAVLTQLKPNIEADVDFLIITRPYARNFDMKQVKQNLIHVLTLAELIPKETEES